MKKYLFVACFILFAAFAKAQDAVLFKIKYLPNHTYQISGNSSISLYADLSANKDFSSKLASQGITQPLNAIINYSTNGNVTTSPVGANNTFPLIMQLSSPALTVTLNGKPIPVPIPVKKNGSKIYAHVNADGIFDIDSLNSEKLNDSTAVPVKKMMNKIMGMVNFPEHPLKIGESFTQTMPFDIPMAKGMVINIKITYKLISIANGKAFFDLTNDLDINLNVKSIGINITGTGIGKMIYDIKNSYPSSVKSNIFMTINVKSDKFTGAATAKVVSDNTFVVN